MKNILGWKQFNENEEYKLSEIPTETINNDLSKFITEVCGFLSGWYIKFDETKRLNMDQHYSFRGLLRQYEAVIKGNKWGFEDPNKYSKMTIEEKALTYYENSAKHFGLTEEPSNSNENAWNTVIKSFFKYGSPSTPAFVGLGRLLKSSKGVHGLRNVTMILDNNVNVIDSKNELIRIYIEWENENPNVK